MGKRKKRKDYARSWEKTWEHTQTTKREEAKQLFYDYKEVVSRKDEIIKDLKMQNDELRKANDELHQNIEKVPKIVRKIFIKENKLLSGK